MLPGSSVIETASQTSITCINDLPILYHFYMLELMGLYG